VESFVLTMTRRAKPATIGSSYKEEIAMKAHLDVVGLIDLVAGAFFTAMGVLVCVGVLLYAPWFNGAPVWRAEDATAVLAVVLVVSAMFVVIGIPNLIAGIGLLKQKRWSRLLAIILAILALLSFPIGTAAGAYTLWVLTRKETQVLLGAAMQQNR
jgi:hypothetical protein